MEMEYYVLGKKDNQMVSSYFDRYYLLLISYLEALSKKGILSQEIGELLSTRESELDSECSLKGQAIEKRDFILSPDQSSIINVLYKELIEGKSQYLGDYKRYEQQLKKEIDLFLNGKHNELTMSQGAHIYGTQIKLTILDNNPYNQMEAHPDHQATGGVMGYGQKSEEEWLRIYEKTFGLLKEIDIGTYTELNQIIKKIVPLGTSFGTHNSASYKECVGHLYMGYTIDSDMPEINNLEAIIHESSHNKLNLILQFDPIVLNDKQEKYYSAIRPDARHIHGIFLGYHAFAPTMYIIMKAYLNGYLGNHKQWFEKIVLYYIKTKFLQKMIKKYAILTELGKEISEEIDYVIKEMDVLIKKLNPSSEVLKRAKERQEQHFQEVNSKYPYLEY
ncbi:MAG: HEXXH motif-containing putative peptide modification protein [Candidatus Gracilibacteria bacterium]|nr:HEXXH motif-containing putative peptide modification protein [Candidatus Gracilibacteria bacterium]